MSEVLGKSVYLDYLLTYPYVLECTCTLYHGTKTHHLVGCVSVTLLDRTDPSPIVEVNR